MRKWLVFPIWAAIGLAVYACDDDNPEKSTQDASAPDAAPTSTTTTPMPGMDASTPDTSVIEPMDSGPTIGPVTVSVVDLTDKPQASIDVYFTEPGGTVVKVATDATGKAVHQMSGGGSVFVALQETNMAVDMTSVLAVQPGDTIKVSPPPPSFVPPSTVGMLTGSITAAPANVDAGPLTYTLDFGGCGAFPSVSPNGPLPEAYSINITSDCVDAAKNVNFLAVAMDGSGNVVAFEPVTVALGADAGQTQADVTTWQAPPTQKSMTFTGTLPPSLDGGSVSNFDVNVGFPKGALSFAQKSTNSFQTPPTQALAYALPPSTFAPNVQSSTSVQGYNNGILETYTLQHFVRAAQTGALSEDFGKLLPFISHTKITGPTTSPTLTWIQDAPLGTDAIGSVSLGGSHSPDGGQPYGVTWQIVFPAQSTTTSVTFPALPAAVAAIAAPDSWQVNQDELAVSAQVPYAIGHLYPTVFLNPSAFEAQVPTGAFDLKTTNVYYGGAF
jgi:hypothetical protein